MHLTPRVEGTFRLLVLATVATLPVPVAGELCAAALRGAGHTTTSALLSCLQVALNAGVVAGIGLGAHAGLVAVPLADVAGGCGEFAIGCFMLRRNGLLATSGRRTAASAVLLRVGVPTAGASILLSMVTLALIAIAAPFGPDAVAALALGSVLEALALAPAFGCGTAMGTLINRSLTRGEHEEAARVFRQGMVLVTTGYAIFAYLMAATPAAAAQGLSANPTVAAALTALLGIVGPAYGATGIVLAAFTVLQQLGLASVTLLLNLVYFTAMLIAGAVVTADGELVNLYRTMAIAAVLGLVIGLPLVYSIAIRAIRKTR